MAAEPAPKGPGRLVWIDLEMTGLDPERDTIIEIATLVTDYDLKLVATGPELVVRQDASRFDAMDDWNKDHHGKSGLWAKVLESPISLAQAEELTLDFIKQHCQARESPLCGNTIWQDRRFLVRYMPKLEAYLHYRMIDVSTIKELANHWYPQHKFKKPKGSHRALDDIQESLDELTFYRQTFFKAPADVAGS